MRHQKKRHKLNRPADQRRALLRTLTTQVLKYGRVTTTEAKAKAVKAEVEHMITLAKRGKEDLSARRAVSSYLLEHRSSQPKVLSLKDKNETVDESRYKVVKRDDKAKKVKVREKTVAQQLFENIAPKYSDRNGGYCRVLHLAPRKGDGAPMALIELV
ncbi:MAG: 50S ribosomal protein L17 [Candidatus Melainabacteria bacterium HGW-Melainabacteria-1]|nr:MAG: 50S ribosomal protein L17 [Candidatus Melainabacteria bacterium HGW-Melainabacteria-1]